VDVPLGDTAVTVLPLQVWTGRAFTALRRGDYLDWARDCLNPGDLQTWIAYDPDGAETTAFFADWSDLTGQDIEGVLSMAAFVDAHAAAVEADLLRYYRTDLRDLWRPGGGESKLTWRRLRVLIDALPGESATKTATRDELSDAELVELSKQVKAHGAWSHSEYLLAQIADLLSWVIFAEYHSQGGKPKPPEPLSRPGVVGKKSRALSDEGREYLRKLRANRGAA
jgi:hypothetical protein